MKSYSRILQNFSG
nr:unnamed protein product [Callosobruchus analis]